MKKKRTKVKGFLSCLVDFISELEISFVRKTKTNKQKQLTSNVLKHDKNTRRATTTTTTTKGRKEKKKERLF